MSQQDIQVFQTAWNFVDDDYSGTVSIQRAQVLLRLIYEKLGLDKPLMLKRMCLEIKKSQTGKTNKVTFHNLLFVIAYKVKYLIFYFLEVAFIRTHSPNSDGIWLVLELPEKLYFSMVYYGKKQVEGL